MNESPLLSVESGIREAIIATIGFVNRPAAKWAMEMIEHIRQHEQKPTSLYYGVAPAGSPPLVYETFYIFFVFADGSHMLSVHDAPALRTLDPIHRSEGGIV